MTVKNKTPRGIRNCNPLNLVRSSNMWLGKIIPGTDERFEQFTHMIYGIRAAMINARTICKRVKGCTIRKLIEIWAPPFENSTEIYIARVCKEMNKRENERVDFKDKELVCSLMMAMTLVECGCRLEPALYEKAYDMI